MTKGWKNKSLPVHFSSRYLAPKLHFFFVCFFVWLLLFQTKPRTPDTCQMVGEDTVLSIAPSPIPCSRAAVLVSFQTVWAQEQGKGKGVTRTTEPWSAYPWSRACAQLRQCSMGGHRREPRADSQEFECFGRCRQGWQASRQCPSSLSVSPRTGPGYSPGRRFHLEIIKPGLK